MIKRISRRKYFNELEEISKQFGDKHFEFEKCYQLKRIADELELKNKIIG